jgi:hypothetical protein
LWQPDKKFSSESIFEVYYTSDAPNWAYWVLLKEDDGSVTWRRYCTPTHDLVAKFDKEKDTRYASVSFGNRFLMNLLAGDSYPLSYKNSREDFQHYSDAIGGYTPVESRSTGRVRPHSGSDSNL